MHSIEKILNVKQSLAALPRASREATRVPAYKAVAMLADEIQALQEKGYTYLMIAEILTTNDIKISGGTLRNYMSRLKNPQLHKAVRKRKMANISSARTTKESVNTKSSDKPLITAPPAVVSNPPLSRQYSSARFTPAPDTDDI
ncbi:MAG: hypothetical protein V4724_02900 [Pseudomonadota bacterium]